ncbi:urease accessory protein UreD [Thermopolyspora flexuosa]|uniref:Urease accessory protein UreD n=1 Tax=Thermopolyspora flexuosa TaxID=103836 RepID=A0A543J0F4_9ACTN|nr:urease accessory protein UreD [Thermopolyspora flexuosa]TQM76302.1 urease accessory protein [Thermopolyspora flexuosa]
MSPSGTATATAPPAAAVPRPPGPSGRASRRAMRARAAIATAATPQGGTTLATLRSDPPLTLRRTGPGRVHLVSTAAGPLGGDVLELDIEVAAGTTLELHSVAATLVLPGAGGPSRMVVTARVGPGGVLRFTPEPTILAAGCDHRLEVRLSLAATASVLWREEIVFGRHGEPPGRCETGFDAVVDGVPLLRQRLAVGDPAVDTSPAVYGTARCVGGTLLAGPAFTPPEGRRGDAAVADGVAVLPLAGPGVLVSALAGDAAELRRRLLWGETLALGRERARHAPVP